MLRIRKLGRQALSLVCIPVLLVSISFTQVAYAKSVNSDEKLEQKITKLEEKYDVKITGETNSTDLTQLENYLKELRKYRNQKYSTEIKLPKNNSNDAQNPGTISLNSSTSVTLPGYGWCYCNWRQFCPHLGYIGSFWMWKHINFNYYANSYGVTDITDVVSYETGITTESYQQTNYSTYWYNNWHWKITTYGIWTQVIAGPLNISYSDSWTLDVTFKLP